MQEFKKILVPVDGSDLSMKAFEKALSFAKLVDGSVDIVHVTDYPTTGPIGMEQPKGLEPGTDDYKLMQSYLQVANERGMDIGTLLKSGIPADVIIGMSDRYDIIIMGNRGMNPITSLVIGSVAEKVARSACCPVMLIKDIEKEECRKDQG